MGGHGNTASVKRALELDMGVFNISPIDKGGRLYQPSTKVAKAIGTKLSPIAMACLHSWLDSGMHTVSIGFGRPEDLAEAMEAAELFANKQKGTKLLKEAMSSLESMAKESVGAEWWEKGLLNVPGPFEEAAQGMGLGHMLWCSNMLHAYGMYETAFKRYKNLLGTAWKPKKSYQENMDAM